MMLEQGDVVYRVEEWRVDRVTVARVTATQTILTDGERFRREDGLALARRSSSRARLEIPTPALDERYRLRLQREAAGRLAYAAEQFKLGDTSQEDRIISLYQEWAELGWGDSATDA